MRRTPVGWNWAGFLPTGLLVLVFLSVINGRLPADGKSLLLFSAVGWGYVISPLCPCDPGCPYWGSASQLVHNLAAIVVYPATTAGLALMAIAFRSDRHWRKMVGVYNGVQHSCRRGVRCHAGARWGAVARINATGCRNGYFRLDRSDRSCDEENASMRSETLTEENERVSGIMLSPWVADKFVL